jgi:hypothetical protein
MTLPEGDTLLVGVISRAWRRFAEVNSITYNYQVDYRRTNWISQLSPRFFRQVSLSNSFHQKKVVDAFRGCG